MGPKDAVTEDDFFRHPLREQINLKHPLVGLVELINWDGLGVTMSESFRIAPWPTGNFAAPDSRTVVLAARVRLVRRRSGLAMGGEPVLAGVHRRDLFAD